MAALFTTPKRSDTTAGTHVAEPDVRRRIGLAHGSWRRVTRRIVAGAVCALTVSSLLMPSVSLAAEWIKVGGNKYNTAASDEAGTWSWDGADDLKLNNYNGGEIQAAGKLNVNYSGTNIVTAEWIESINVSHGTNENAELNIQGDEGGTLSVTSTTEDAILSTGNINIDGAGSVNATSAGFDAINAGGDLAIKGSGNVNATGASDGIRANGNITIDDSGAVTARATKDKGIGADKNLTIKGDGTVEASSADGEALWSGGNINISDGSQVKANAEGYLAVDTEGSLAVTNASLDASGVEYGVYAHKGVTLDHATVTVRTSANGGQAIALITDGGDIDIKNGSTVDAFAEGEVSAAFSTRNDRPNEKGGHIYISDSVVKAIARYVENGDGPIPYSENQDGETRREPQGENIGIIAQTSEGVTPAVISIIRSKVTAEGDTAAIFARAMSADGKTIGTIKIENAAIQTPEGGKVIDYRKLRDGIYEAGQAIGTGDATVDSLYIKAVAKSTTIAPPEVAKPEDPKPDETKPAESKPAESKQNPKPEGSKPTKAVASSSTKAKTTGVLAATGDTSGAAIVATVLAGTAAIAAGTMASRKRS